jgi:hypothetical protein
MQAIKNADNKKRSHWAAFFMFGASNEVRTRDLDLGKVALYQLSYTRENLVIYS